MNLSEMGVSLEIAKELTSSDIDKISVTMAIPYGIASHKLTGLRFLNAMKCWEGFDTHKFDYALGTIGRNDSVATARKLSWLSQEYATKDNNNLQLERCWIS